MTDKPTPTDWPSANAAWQAALHPPTPAAPDLDAIMQRAQWWQHRLMQGDYADSDAVMYAEEASNDVYALVAELRTARQRIAALEDARDAMRRAAEDYAAKWRNELLGNVQDSIDLPEQPYEAAAANRLLAERATELGWLTLTNELSPMEIIPGVMSGLAMPVSDDLPAPKVARLTKAQRRILAALTKGPRRESESAFIFRGNTNALIGLERRRWITRDYDTGVARITPAGRAALSAAQAKDVTP